MSAFDEHILNNPSVCNNCYRRIRRPRPTPPQDRTSRQDLLGSTTTRCRDQTSVEHVPDHPPTDDYMMFCECGVESAFDRERSKWQADPVREFAMQVSRTLNDLNVDHDRRTFFAHAMDYHRGAEDYETDELLAMALDRAIAVTVASSTQAVAD